jgi:Tfp pilus assembly protein PilF
MGFLVILRAGLCGAESAVVHDRTGKQLGPQLKGRWSGMRTDHAGGLRRAGLSRPRRANVECSEQFLSARRAEPREPLLSVPSASVEQLRHKAPKKAQKAFERGIKFERSGDHRRAADEYEKAIMGDQRLADAHNQLGIEYAQLGRLSAADTELRRSLTLDPGSWSAHYNLALVLFQERDFVGPEKSARQALDLSRTNAQVHLFLGLVLVNKMETAADGIQHLRYAARTLAVARLV